MKHFYFFSLAMIALFSTQLLFAQTSNSTVSGQSTGLIASRADFSNSGIDLNYRSGFLPGNNTVASVNKNDEGVSTAKKEYAKPGFQITASTGINFEADFTAPKSGKAELSIKTISGQVIYKENISIIKGSNSQLIKAQQLKSGMYLISIINEQVNYNGKIQKM